MIAGWVITETPWDDEDDGRIGRGQFDKAVVTAEAEALFARRITVETGDNVARLLAYAEATGDELIPWRCWGDGEQNEPDGKPDAIGLISRSWLDGPEHLAFAPLAYCEADYGSAVYEVNEGLGWEMV